MGNGLDPDEPEDRKNLYNLLDGDIAEVQTVLSELGEEKRIAADSNLPLEKRLEAFEDIFESEVGDTTLARARNIEREFGLRQVFLKFEGGNPTGTQKDRIAFTQVMDALRRGYDVITMATCGNYGVAVAFAAAIAGLKCLTFIPEKYHTKRIQEMKSLGAEIIRVPGDYEDAVKTSSRKAEEADYYDANPGGNNTALQIKGYGEIAYEIYDELRDSPAVISLPVSNGTTLAGVHKGFLSLYRRGKISRLPRIVAGSAHSKNPIVNAFVKNLPHCSDLNPKKMHESQVNEPLINWHSIDGEHALEAIRSTEGWATDATDKNMLFLAKLLREKEGLNVLPASTAGLYALIREHLRSPLKNDRYVVILTVRKA